MPPLRERREDIPVLVDFLVKKINKDLHKSIAGVSKEMMDIFMQYRWPGNIRELENLLVRAAVIAHGQILGKVDFPDLLGGAQAEAAAEEGAVAKPGMDASGRLLTLDEVEEQHIRLVISKIGRNKGEICESLGISRPTLERKLEKYGITFE
jgi:two-component system response regulator AtoC